MQFQLTRTVRNLLIALVVVFVLQQSFDRWLLEGAPILRTLALTPKLAISQFRLWQLVTYSFVHADVSHLVLNGLMLVFLGSELESLWGMRKFVLYWFFCVFVAATLYVLTNLVAAIAFESWTGISLPMMGASAGIYGLLVAYGILFAERTMLFMMIFPMKAKHFVWILGGIELFSSVFSQGSSGLGSLSHLFGMVAGFGLLVFWAKMRIRSSAGGLKLKSHKPSQRRNHLKLVSSNKPTKSNDDRDDDDSSPPRTWH